MSIKSNIAVKQAVEEFIEVRRARVHNLKNVSCKLPLNKLTVITGVSGSGKSSLAFDTIYAEGQRRYVESLSAYARQFLERMEKPDVDEILGIAPAIAIRQKNSTRNPRSTVATQTEIYDYLRLLFARVGTTICYKCGAPVKKDSPESAAADILSNLANGTRFYILFPVSVFRKAENEKVKTKEKTDRSTSRQLIIAQLMELFQRGFTRFFFAGKTFDLQKPEDFPLESLENVYVLVDRLKAEESINQRLVDSLEVCFQNGNGNAVIETAEAEPQVFRFSDKFICKNDGTVFETPEPQLFSFNSPFGACPNCQGFGNAIGIDDDLVVPNPLLSIEKGAIEPFTKPQADWALTELLKYCRTEQIPVNIPFIDLTAEQKRAILKGKGKFGGVKGFFDFLETKKYKLHVRVFLAKYRGYTPCPECGGGRLRIEARAIKIGGKSLPETVSLAVKDCREFFGNLQLSPEESQIAEKLIFEITERLKFLDEVGLDYLTLDRLASTLSGGEAQRIQLATNLGSSLVGALYVLDEPSIGLHPRDNTRLINILQNLRDIGNTVLVVEHDEETMRFADHILDIGLHAGELGGNVVFEA